MIILLSHFNRKMLVIYRRDKWTTLIVTRISTILEIFLILDCYNIVSSTSEDKWKLLLQYFFRLTFLIELPMIQRDEYSTFIIFIDVGVVQPNIVLKIILERTYCFIIIDILRDRCFHLLKFVLCRTCYYNYYQQNYSSSYLVLIPMLVALKFCSRASR